MENFLKNGAVISLSDQKTFFASEFVVDEDLTVPYFLAPKFDLKNLNLAHHPKFLTPEIPLSVLEAAENTEFISFDWVGQWAEYKSSYDITLSELKAGNLKKAVPFVEFQTKKPKDFNQNFLPQILNKLLKGQSMDQFVYGHWSDESGFVGLTPEILLQKKTKHKYCTIALAGTLPSTDLTNMLDDEKLFQEHQFVVRSISESLRDQNLTWSLPSEKNYGILKHLYAEAKFESGLTIQQLVSRLSPTSAVGVYPSELWPSQDQILRSELRGSFGAPFGFVTLDEAQILICLRGLFWDKTYLRVFVGGGITAKSDFNTEVQELELKFKSTKLKLGF